MNCIKKYIFKNKKSIIMLLIKFNINIIPNSILQQMIESTIIKYVHNAKFKWKKKDLIHITINTKDYSQITLLLNNLLSIDYLTNQKNIISFNRLFKLNNSLKKQNTQKIISIFNQKYKEYNKSYKNQQDIYNISIYTGYKFIEEFLNKYLSDNNFLTPNNNEIINDWKMDLSKCISKSYNHYQRIYKYINKQKREFAVKKGINNFLNKNRILNLKR